MSVDISGSMIVGAEANEITLPEDYEGGLGEWCEDNGMDYMSPWYDSDPDNWIIGFKVPDVLVDDIKPWLSDVKKLAKEFQKLTGVKAELIGTQDVG